MTDVAVVGSGAIGATFAAAAERAGRAVALCGRRPGPAPETHPRLTEIAAELHMPA